MRSRDMPLQGGRRRFLQRLLRRPGRHDRDRCSRRANLSVRPCRLRRGGREMSSSLSFFPRDGTLRPGASHPGAAEGPRNERRQSNGAQLIQDQKRPQAAALGAPRTCGSSFGEISCAAVPVLTVVAAAALVGLFLLKRRLLPFRLASRFVVVAVPVVLPLLVRRIAGRTPAS
jgi:hypothetical protein